MQRLTTVNMCWTDTALYTLNLVILPVQVDYQSYRIGRIDVFQSAEMEVTEKHDSFWGLLRTTFETVVPFTEKYRDYFIVYLDIGSPSMGEFALELSNDFEGWSVELFSEAVKNAQSKGEIRKDLDIKDVAYLLDNHLLLFAFSRVSEHYNRRFNQFFGNGREEMSDAKKVDCIMTSLKRFLK